MFEKRQIIIQFRNGSSVRKVSRDLKIHRGIVSKIRQIALIKGWLDPARDIPSDVEIASCFACDNQPTHMLDAHLDRIKQWRLDGLTAVVIQRLLREHCGCKCGISSLRRYLKRTCHTLPHPVMIRQTSAGEHMDVDFGFLGYLWDQTLCKERKAWVFSARLRHSRKAYREIVWKQDTSTFLMAHIRAFRHFGGVPKQVILDNLKAGVIKSSIDNDLINRAYGELAEYYGFSISPCLPRTPQHKGGVENDIHYIKRNFWPEILERKKTKKNISIQEAQELIERWDLEVANVRKLQAIGRTPKEIFSSEEQSALKRLPESDWEPIEWFQCIVGRDWRITCLGAHYSVPYECMGQTVYARVSAQQVQIYFEYNQVARHPRATEKGEYRRNPDHAPPFKEAVLACTREGLLLNAEEIGPYVRLFCEKMFSDAHIDKLRPVRHLLRLALSYEKVRIDQACARALAYNTIRYRSVKDILEKGLDLDPIHPPKVVGGPCSFRFTRDPSEYRAPIAESNQ